MNEDCPTNSNGSDRRPPEGEPVEMRFQDAERMLLQQVVEQKDDPRQAMWELAQLYKLSGRHEQALTWLRDLMRRLPDVEQKAQCVFTMGQSAEKVGDFVAAVRYYKEALGMEPAHTFTWYFLLNNLGYSLNQLGNFTEGERYCRKAIEVDGSRCNAHKNLGLALAGQGLHRQAAECYVTATMVNGSDPRSLNLLRGLLEQHPELAIEFGDELAACERAVNLAAGLRNAG
ncbi:MAG: tetratricopeptide repeat protein [Verrucomicrobia bacterium]|nr:tetratricopeptide repeat protein [Verrucomicrobiota bacterium]